MAAKTLAERMRERRMFWVELEPGANGAEPKRVQLLRPPETQIGRLLKGMSIEDAASAAVGWSGFTEADLLGPGVGGSDPAPFSPEAWRELVLDNVAFANKAMGELVAAVAQHLERMQAAQGN